MGAADVVPGVSGGTVALVLGIYERLVHAIRSGSGALGSIVRGRYDDALEHFRSVDWRFLLVLLSGILLAVVSLARLIEHFLEEEPQNTAAVFFGLVAGSIAIAWALVERWNPVRLVVAAASAVVACAVLGLRTEAISDPSMALFLGAGAIAIIAMILPGISGSFILLMLGMYEAVLAAVNDRDFGVVIVFVIGAVIGLALFSTVLDKVLRDDHDTVMAVLIGLMTGSLRVLWPWPDGTDSASVGAPEKIVAPLLLAAVAVIAVLSLGKLSRRSPQSGSPPVETR